MSIHLLCPQGHSLFIRADQLGQEIFCPQCFSCMVAEPDWAIGHHARPEKGKARSSRDDDDDDEEEEERPQKKKRPAAKEEQEKPSKKKAPSKKQQEEDDEDEEEDEQEPQLEEDAIRWNKKKRRLSVVNKGLLSYLISFYLMLAMFGIMALLEVPCAIFLVIAAFNEQDGMAFLFWFCAIIAGLIGAVPIYIGHIIGWILELFAPSKAEMVGVCITAMLLFIGPVFLYIVYFILVWILTPSDLVSANMLLMFHMFAFIFWMVAMYCSFLSVSRVAAYMGMTTEKFKPTALGWFIVGGNMLLVLCMVAVPFVPRWARCVVAGITCCVYYFVLTAVWETTQIVGLIRKNIDDYIKNG
jgi:hypothetical protein